MVVGFNHNFRYKGEVYHIQTEDGGLRSPNIVTLLYRGGTILASKRTSYADIAKVDNLEQVVEELMKEQHKEMLRRLKAAEFDEVIARFEAGRSAAGSTPPVEVPEEAPAPPPAQVTPKPAPRPEPARLTAEPPAAAAAKSKPPSKQDSTVETSLDEIILSYLMGEED